MFLLMVELGLGKEITTQFICSLEILVDLMLLRSQLGQQKYLLMVKALVELATQSLAALPLRLVHLTYLQVDNGQTF
jgi:hypothetical protein